MPTYSTAEGSSGHHVVLELKIVVKHGGVKLCFAVEAVAYAFPVGCRF